MTEPKIKRKKITDYKPNPKNHNLGSERGQGMIEHSFRELGAGRSLVVDANGVLIAGNHAQEGAVNAGIEDVIEVETDGRTVVVVKRVDLDLETDARAVQLAYADNRTQQVGFRADVDQLVKDIEAGIDLSALYTPAEIGNLLGQIELPNLDPTPKPLTESFMVLITCKDEAEQKHLLERFEREGIPCRALIS